MTSDKLLDFPSLQFFQDLWKTSKRISFNTSGKGDLIIRNLSKFKGDASKTSENVVWQSHKILPTFVWKWPHQTNVCKIQWRCKAIAALIFNKWLLNLATLPIFRPSTLPCWWAFANRPSIKLIRLWKGLLPSIIWLFKQKDSLTLH